MSIITDGERDEEEWNKILSWYFIDILLLGTYNWDKKSLEIRRKRRYSQEVI